MQRDEGYGISLPELCRVLRRHAGKMVLFFGLAMLTAVAAVFLLPRTYRSEARILVRMGRSTVALDPTATLGQTNPVHKPLDAEILSVQAAMFSRSLLEQTVDQLGPEFILGAGDPHQSSAESESSGPGILDRLRSLAAAVGAVDEATPRDGAIRMLEKSIAVYLDPGSSVLVCDVRANHAARAQKILQTYLDSAMAMHLAINRTPGEHQFFVEQLEVLERQWKAKASELHQFKNERKLTSIEGQRRILEQELQVVETDLLSSTTALQESVAELKSLSEQYASVPRTQNAEEVSGVSNQASDLLRQTYYGLLIQEAEMAARYQPSNPKLVQLRKQIEVAEQAVAAEPDSRSQITEAANPTRVKLELELITQRARAESLRARIQSLGQQMEDLHERVAALNRDEQPLMDLQQQVETLAASSQRYREDLEQSRVTDAMRENAISNLNIIQPATLVPQAESPKLIVLLALGLAIGGGGAIGIALLAEFMRRSFREDWASVHYDMDREIELSSPAPAPAPARPSRAAREGEPVRTAR